MGRNEKTHQNKSVCVFLKLLVLALMFCCCETSPRCCGVLHLDEMEMEMETWESHMQSGIDVLPTDSLKSSTHTQTHTPAHTLKCLTSVFLLFLVLPFHIYTHKGRFKPISLPLAFLPTATSNVFNPPPNISTPPPPKKIIHYFFYISFSLPKPIFLSGCLACSIRLCVK